MDLDLKKRFEKWAVVELWLAIEELEKKEDKDEEEIKTLKGLIEEFEKRKK